MSPEAADRPASVSLLALPETTPATLYGLYEVLSSVGVAWPALTGEAPAGPTMDVRIVACSADPFVCSIGTPIAPHASLAETSRTDSVIVSDLALAADFAPAWQWPTVSRWLRDQYCRGATICSVCTGAVLLANAGLLDGLEATTHWSAVPLFETRFPAVKLRPERILSRSGPNERIITGGGASAWEDLALYLIARFSSPAEAIRAAKVFVLGDHSEGQLLYAALTRPKRHDDGLIGDCQTWIAEHYAEPAPVARLVKRSGLNERTFKRRFRAATGYSPVHYVQTVRIEEAKQMLESTSEPVDTVASAVGYQDPAFFRRLFKRHTGVTPARYRQRFQGIMLDSTEVL
jgi:transcriptional regulator GlxA family with amidase domain